MIRAVGHSNERGDEPANMLEHVDFIEVDPIDERDGPSDELDPIDLVETEAERLLLHPRNETRRLKLIASDGERGTAPFIEMALIARWIIPLVLLIVGIVLGIYLAIR